MLICPSFFDGRLDGIGRVSGAFFDAIAERTGIEPFILSANDPIGATTSDSGRAFGRNYPRMMLEAAFNRKLRRRVERRMGSYPIVCTHLGISPVARLMAARCNHCYFVVLHGIECWKPLRLRSRWGLSGAARLLFNSDYTRWNFLRLNPWASGIPAEVVHLGVPVPGLHTSVPRFRTERTEFKVLCVGRISKAEYYEDFRDGTDLYKGFKQLILAIGIVAQSFPGVRLGIVGDGDARADLEAWLATRDERKLVKMLGRVSDTQLRELYATSDIFALPSEGEGFGLVFAEAMSHGLPSVCADAGAAPEVVENGVTGLVARPRDVEDLATKILRLAGDRELRDRLSIGARRRFEERYTLAHFRDRIIRALESGEGRGSSGE